ncbi:uncharacterized protein LOC118434466 [Folsomia candida]|nr:uncharacterized protein LOC118434466 [Folsomia candida]
MVGLAKCYNPYCDCHILEDETKNPLLARDEQAMDHIIQRMRADQEEFRPSLLRLLDQRDQKEGSYQLREDNSVTRNMQEDDADEIFGGAWTEASSTTQEDFTPKFRFHEVSSGQIGHGHHSDHHALRDICSRGRLFEWDESSVQFLLKPNNKATAGQPPSDVNDRGGIVSKIGWGINDITTDDETSEAASFEYKLIDHPKLVGDDDDEFLEDVGDEDDQDYDDDDNSGEEEVLENSEDEENDDNNDVPAGVNQNVHAQHNDDVDEEARQRTSGGGDGGRPPPQH